MVSGVEGCDVALFLGYQAKFGTAKSTFDHTYSGRTINKVEVHGVATSEFLLNAYAAGDFNVHARSSTIDRLSRQHSRLIML